MVISQDTNLQNGKYRIVRVLGQGGFGITYLAEHTLLDKRVAIKEFFPKEYCDRDESTSRVIIGTKSSVEIVEMLKGKFIKEARNISRLNHPNIITIHDIFQENDTAYYVMEYIDGESLAEIVKRRGALPESEAVGYIRKVADAVGYMHSLRMNHLDLKPANIMVRKSDGEPILIDFGLSKQYDASGGQTSTTPIGISHGFAPIEQYRPGGVATFTPQTDIYALGATLFNLITGIVPPHYSEILEEGLPELPASVSQQCTNAVKHALAINKKSRPASISEFISFLCETSCVEPQTTPDKSSITNSDNNVLQKTESHSPRKGIHEIDETILIDSNASNNASKVSISHDSDIMIDNIVFADLGLSVRWAGINIGATNETDSGRFFAKPEIESGLNLIQLKSESVSLPTFEQFQELLSKCKWTWSEIDGFTGYTIIGPNGNSIKLPLTGDGLLYPGLNKVTFGLLWTKESTYCQNELKLLYFNRNTREVISFTTNIHSPIRLVMK